MSGLEVAGTVLGLFPGLIEAPQVQEQFIKLSSSAAAEKSVEVELRIARRKFRVWQESWLGGEDRLDASVNALWGSQGWDTVQNMLKKIFTTHTQIQQISDNLETSSIQSKWKLAIERHKRQSKPRFSRVIQLARLKHLVQELNNAIDTVWLYSETAFDSLHRISKIDLGPQIRRQLLDLAVTSRDGSLELFEICCASSANCYLDLDLDRDNDFRRPLSANNVLTSLSFAVLPPLSMQARARRVVVENHPGSSSDVPDGEKMVDCNQPDTHLFDIDAGTDGAMISINRSQGSKKNTLRIRTERASLRPESEKLAGLLQRGGEREDRYALSAPERLSVAAKTKLAYQLVQSGFFLLGTPWLSVFKSQNVFRRSDYQNRPDFMLQVQTLGLDDLLLDDSEALSETEQLFHIGVLLMEIALDSPDNVRLVTNSSQSIELLHKLPLVERSMGTQYCKATAFCLQRHQTDIRFKGPQKYDEYHAKGWQEYLKTLLQDYYEQVLLEFGELQALKQT